MITDFSKLSKYFVLAARRLDNSLHGRRNAKTSGFTSTGQGIYNFTVFGRVFSAIQQNTDPSKTSTGARLARRGHPIYQIRDNSDDPANNNNTNALLGFVDLTNDSFNVYNNLGQVDDLTNEKLDDLDVEVLPSGTGAPRRAMPNDEMVSQEDLDEETRRGRSDRSRHVNQTSTQRPAAEQRRPTNIQTRQPGDGEEEVESQANKAFWSSLEAS